MTLTVKNKIWMGTLFLFFLLLVTGGVGIYFMAKLKKEGKNVLQANYESLAYSHTMQSLLNTEQNTIRSFSQFDTVLLRQEKNITENGEKTATDKLRSHFDKLKTGDSSNYNVRAIAGQLQAILAINMEAIQRKSRVAEKTADDALTILITLGSLVFLIAFTFMVNFPGIVTNPISRLTEAIKEIANKNYKHRIHIKNKDEFGTLANSFNEMAERLEYFENSSLHKLMFEKNRAEAVINSLKDASIGIDKNEVVLFANYQALQLLGLRAEEIVAKPVKEIMQKNDLFAFLMETDSTAPFKIVVDNRENYFVKETLEIEQSATRNRVMVIKNITSFKELDAAKTNFISTISHELKTPLAASDLSLKLLEDPRVGTITQEQRDLVNSLRQDNQRMLKILSELLNMSQVEAGKIQLNIQEVNPHDIIHNAMATVATSAKDKDLSLVTIQSAALPVIKADPDKILWVLNNFLTNAVKFSYPGGTIEVGAFSETGSVIFFVKDNGPGIETIYHQRLFEKYFQVPGTREKGTGLGLAISREFAEAQQGRIWVESEIGKGATFKLKLPA